MNFKLYIPLIMLLILGLFVVEYRAEEGNTLNSLQSNFSGIVDQTNRITIETFPYKNPYQENFTMIDFVKNTIHVVAYPVINEVHTAIGFGINFIYKNIEKEMVYTFFKIISIIIIILIMLNSIKPIGIIYVLLTEYFEKRNKKVKEWTIVLMAIGIVSILCLIIAGVVLLI